MRQKSPHLPYQALLIKISTSTHAETIFWCNLSADHGILKSSEKTEIFISFVFNFLAS
jgi:hypothetical protein